MLSVEVLPYSLAVFKAAFFELKVPTTRIGSYEENEAGKAYCAPLLRLENRICRWAQGEARGSGEAAERVLCARVQGY